MPTALHQEPHLTGIDLIDEQHRVLFRMILEFREAHFGNESPGLLIERASQLYQYALVHFETEEGLIEAYAPTFLEGHRAAHQRVAEMIRNAVVEYKRSGNTIPSSLFDRLDDYCQHHVNGADVEVLRRVREGIRDERIELLTSDPDPRRRSP